MEVKTIPYYHLYGGTHVVEEHISRAYREWWFRMSAKYFTPTSPDQWTVVHGAHGGSHG